MSKYIKTGSEDYPKLLKLSEKYEAKEKTMDKQFQTDLAAESLKFAVKDVPFSYSDLLKNSKGLFYEITNVCTALNSDGEPILVYSLKANKDFIVPKYQNMDYTIYFRFIDKDKSALENGAGVIMPIATNFEPVSVKAGDAFPEQQYPVSVGIPNRANFAGVEFLSNEEHKKLIGL